MGARRARGEREEDDKTGFHAKNAKERQEERWDQTITHVLTWRFLAALA